VNIIIIMRGPELLLCSILYYLDMLFSIDNTSYYCMSVMQTTVAQFDGGVYVVMPHMFIIKHCLHWRHI